MKTYGQHCTYRRVHFRSLLEARWAAYFDHILLDWEYEPATFFLTQHSSEIFYKPDFFLPSLKLYVEIKGQHLDRLAKVGHFVKTTKQSVLMGREQGRFVLVSYLNDEPEHEGDISPLPDALIDGDTDFLDIAMERYSSLSTDDSGNFARFTNWGEISDCYVGAAPDYFDTMKDRADEAGNDARSYYWGGMSTWRQRGFQLPPNKIRRVHAPFAEGVSRLPK